GREGAVIGAAARVLHARDREGRAGVGPREAPLRETPVDPEARRPAGGGTPGDREARGPAREGTPRRPPPLGLQPGRNPTVYLGRQPHMGVYWLRFGRRTVWEKRAVIPDVT